MVSWVYSHAGLAGLRSICEINKSGMFDTRYGFKLTDISELRVNLKELCTCRVTLVRCGGKSENRWRNIQFLALFLKEPVSLWHGTHMAQASLNPE